MPSKQAHASRAKLFLPFDALKGFQAALRQKERIQVARPCLSEEAMDELNRRLMRVEKRTMVRVVYYHEGSYIEQQGWVSAICKETQTLTVVQTKIPFRDLYVLEGPSLETENIDFNGDFETFSCS
jgi:hypothetical protein